MAGWQVMQRRWQSWIFLIIFMHSALGIAAEMQTVAGQGLLPASRPFPPLPSDSRDLKTALRKTDADTWEAEVGSYRSIYGWTLGGDPASVIHAGIEGNAYFTMQKQGSRFPLESSDGLVGVYLEAKQGASAIQLRFTHISAHLSDGSPNVTRAIRFSRETLSLRLAQDWNWLRGYVGVHWLVHTIPASVPKLGGQLGFYAAPAVGASWWRPYFGADYRVRGGAEGYTLDLSGGIALESASALPPIRFGFHYLHGHDLRGQFFDRKIRRFAFGLEMDLAI